MKPWEEACPSGQYAGTEEPHDRHCALCHGAGYVPMTTDEMLEALKPTSLGYLGEGWWVVEWDKSDVTARTPTDALRAALEAVKL